MSLFDICLLFKNVRPEVSSGRLKITVIVVVIWGLCSALFVSLFQDVTPDVFLAVLSGDKEKMKSLGYPDGRVINRYSVFSSFQSSNYFH